MKMTETPTSIFPDDVKAELQKALENTKGGITDPEAAKKACERMDRIREENRRLLAERDSSKAVLQLTLPKK